MKTAGTALEEVERGDHVAGVVMGDHDTESDVADPDAMYAKFRRGRCFLGGGRTSTAVKTLVPDSTENRPATEQAYTEPSKCNARRTIAMSGRSDFRDGCWWWWCCWTDDCICCEDVGLEVVD